MKLKPTKYAHLVFIINTSYYKNKSYDIRIDRQRDLTKNRKLKRRSHEVSRFTIHYSLYRNVDFELAKAIYTFTDIYYSIFIK